jgi:hypothetical protein
MNPQSRDCRSVIMLLKFADSSGAVRCACKSVGDHALVSSASEIEFVHCAACARSPARARFRACACCCRIAGLRARAADHAGAFRRRSGRQRGTGRRSALLPGMRAPASRRLVDSRSNSGPGVAGFDRRRAALSSRRARLVRAEARAVSRARTSHPLRSISAGIRARTLRRAIPLCCLAGMRTAIGAHGRCSRGTVGDCNVNASKTFVSSSVPVPTFVSLCSTLSYEPRNQRDTSKLYDSSVAFGFDVPANRLRQCW